MTATVRFKRLLWVVALLVCPLIFFTNLTRNPYQTQICLLNIVLAALALIGLLEAARSGQALRLPKTPLDLPLAAWLGACALSWAVSYLGHADFYKPAIRSEGAIKALFLIINTAIPFYLAAELPAEDDAKPSPGSWAAFVVIWGLAWLSFPMLRGPGAGATRHWLHVWDWYGALLWLAGVAWCYRLCRSHRASEYWHLALAAGVLASAYGVCQYFGKDFIWPMTLNPYGGRSVSTFGNPNFLSSFAVVLLPVAAVFFVNAKTVSARIIYAAAFLTLEADLVCSMTRSSWAGGIFAVALLGLSKDMRRKMAEEPRWSGLLAAAAVALVLFWPQNQAPGYGSGVINRFSEIVSVQKQQGHYAPFHQRVLIWACAWMMGAENPVTGKGWGLLELFYPFYQGHLLDQLSFFVDMRTHANNAHNEILEVFSQTGIVGLGVTLWLWLVFFGAARRNFAASLRVGSALGATCGAAGMLADNLLNVSLHFAVPALLFWWAAGQAVGTGGGDWRIPRLERRWGGALTAVLAAFLIGTCHFWARTWFREVHYFAGFKLLRQPALPEAIKELQLAKAWGPREVNSIYELGNAYARAERYPEALEAYLLSLKANAGYDEIYFNMGTLLSARMGDVARAEEYLRTAWWINPLSAEVYLGLSTIYLRDPQRYRARARELLERAVHFFPNQPHHWSNLGYIYNLDGTPDKAEDAYARALNLDPDMRIAEQNLRASLSGSKNRPPGALSGLDSLRQAEARVVAKDYSQATLALARAASDGLPNSQRARFLYGSLLLAHNKIDEAKAHLEWVIAGYPQHLTARLNLAAGYLREGRFDKAREQLRAVLTIDPQNEQAKRELSAIEGR